MARVIASAVADRERPLREDLVVLIDGLRVRLSRGDTARAVEGTRRRRGTHNEKRAYAVRRILDLLVSRYKSAAIRAYRERRDERGAPLSEASNVRSMFDRDGAFDVSVASVLARGESPPPGWDQELRSRLRSRPEVREALERMWPALSGAELVNDLFGFPALVRSAAEGVLTDDEQALLHRRREPDVSAVALDGGRCRARRRGRRAARTGRGGAACNGGAGATATTPSTPRTASSTISDCTATPTRRPSPSGSGSRRRTDTRRRASRARSGTCSSTRRRT